MNDLVSFDNVGALIQNTEQSATSMGGDLSYLRFHSKDDGIWTVDGLELTGDEIFLVDIRTLAHGWMCWSETLGGEPRKVMTLAMKEPMPPQPAQLEGFKPWSMAWGVGLVLEADGSACYAENNTWGWKKVYQEFVLGALTTALKAQGAVAPRVTLGNNGRQDKNGNLYPVINVVEMGSVALLEPAAEEEPEPAPQPQRRRRRAVA